MTETWLTNSHLAAELQIDGYSIFRQDRQRKKAKFGRSSGGVAVYVRDEYAVGVETLFQFTNGTIESLGISVPVLNLVLVITYRSPDATTRGKDVHYRSTNKEFSVYVKKLRIFLESLPSPTPTIVMMGDLNMPHANWTTGQCTPGASTDEQEMVSGLYGLTLDHFLTQEYDCPTHRAGNTIDLMFTNNSDLVHNIESFPSSVSDHLLVNTTTTHNTTPPSANEGTEATPDDEHKSFRSLNFFNESVDWQALTEELQSTNWFGELHDPSTSDMLKDFTSVCLNTATKWVPARISSDKKQPHQRVHKQRRSLMRRRTSLKKQYIATKSECKRASIDEKLTQIEKALQKSHCEERQHTESRAVDKIKTNPKFFYTFARRYSKIKVGVGPLINSDKKTTSSPQEMTEILSDQYSSVFSDPSDDNIDANTIFPEQHTTDTPSLSQIQFSDSELAGAMNNLATNAAPGPDGFPAILLKKCSSVLAPPLALIWRKSLETSDIPTICKSATITPIHKGKSRAMAKNYRPVALTSHLIKVFEKVVRSHIVNFMSDHTLFNSTQHGFRGGHSCLSQLLNHFDKITCELESGKGVDVIYLDFAKAFDKLDHGITLKKLEFLGIKGLLGRWIATFLTNRTQSVVIDGHKSSPKPVISGVPQGSVLGPLLFLVLIGDIDKEVMEAFLSSFADDTRVGKGISTPADTVLLQSDLNAVYNWSVINNMLFNSDKFELVRYESKASKQTQAETSYSSNDGSIINETKHVRDLGVTLSNDATFNQHITDRCELVKAKVAWILRTFHSRDRLPMLTLWKTLVLCHLDYCSQLWSPSDVGSTQRLELLQKAFTSRIEGMSSLNYWDQLRHLRLQSLERRRERYQIIYTWRIIEGQVPNFDSTPIKVTLSDRRGRSCVLPSIASTASHRIKSIRFASLPHKGPRLFNCLPLSIRALTNCSVTVFKGQLDRFLSSLPDQPLIPSMTAYRQCESNSVIDWINHQRRLTKSTLRPLLGQEDSLNETAR